MRRVRLWQGRYPFAFDRESQVCRVKYWQRWQACLFMQRTLQRIQEEDQKGQDNRQVALWRLRKNEYRANTAITL